MLSPPQPQHRDDRRRSRTSETFNNNTTLSSSPEVPRRSYSPISNSEDLASKEPTTAPAPLASDGSSGLSDVDDQSDDNKENASDEASNLSDDDPTSDNETEAETERLHISPQKIREQQLVDQEDGPAEDEEEQQPDTKVRPDLRPQDILGEAQDDRESSLSEAEDIDAEALRSPGAIAGHKRKRNGELSPSNNFLSADSPSPRKRSSIRRSFGLKPPPAEPVMLEEAGPAGEDAVSSEDEEQEAIDKIESARIESLTPAPEQEEEVRPDAEPEEPAELEAEEDETEAAAKTEDDSKMTYTYKAKPRAKLIGEL